MCELLAQTFLNEAVEAATEGLIVKTLSDTYEPAKRSSHWLKVGGWAAQLLGRRMTNLFQKALRQYRMLVRGRRGAAYPSTLLICDCVCHHGTVERCCMLCPPLLLRSCAAAAEEGLHGGSWGHV
jgi:hypothetical protein